MQRHQPISRRGAFPRGRRRRRIAISTRAGLTVWVYTILFATGAALFALDVTHHRFARDARQAVVDIASPVLGAASGAVLVVKSWIDETRDFVGLHEEVERLREENRSLRTWKRRAQELEGRARRFEALLNLQPDPETRVVTARAIADTGTHFARSMIINAGAGDGISEGNAVLGAEGLVGRVISVGAQSARVLLVSDLKSRIPVHVGTGRHRSILAGTNGEAPTLLYLPVGAGVSDGDLVVTSGDDRLLPPGLPVGQVHRDADETVSVELASDPAGVEFVRVLDYRVAIDVSDGAPPLPAVIAGPTGMASADHVEAAVGPGEEAPGAAPARP